MGCLPFLMPVPNTSNPLLNYFSKKIYFHEENITKTIKYFSNPHFQGINAYVKGALWDWVIFSLKILHNILSRGKWIKLDSDFFLYMETLSKSSLTPRRYRFLMIFFTHL